jgi:hypothetical protein
MELPGGWYFMTARKKDCEPAIPQIGRMNQK